MLQVTIMKTALLALIRFYQLTLSAIIGRRCRYLPTCSDYASDAIRKHGVKHGVALGFAQRLGLQQAVHDAGIGQINGSGWHACGLQTVLC